MIKKTGLIISCLIMLFVVGCFEKEALKPTVISNQSNTYIFVQMTDNHLGYKPVCIPVTKKLIEEINKYAEQRPIEFIAITGDLISGGKYDLVMEDYNSIREKSKYPIYAVAGNNEFDLHGGKGTNTDKTVVDKYAKMWKENFGELNYCVDIRDVRFIFVATDSLVYGLEIDGTDVYKWLEARLNEAKSSSKDIIIFTHTPIVKNYYKGKVSSPYPDDEYERLKNLVNKYNVSAIVAGHYHSDDLYTADNVPVYVCPPSVDFHCGSGSYRVYEYNAETNFLQYTTYVIK